MVLDLVGQDALVVAPAHSYTGTLMQLADLEALQGGLAPLTEIRAAIAELQARESGSETLAPELQALRTAHESLRPELQALRSAQEGVRPELQSVRSGTESLRSDLESIRSATEGLRPELDAIRSAGDAVRQELESLRNADGGIGPELEGLRQAHEALRPELEALGDRVDKLASVGDVARMRDSVVLALTERIDGLVSRPSVTPEELAEALTPLQNRLSVIAAGGPALDRIQALDTRLQGLEEMLAALGQRVSTVGESAGGVPAVAADIRRVSEQVEGLAGVSTELAAVREQIAATSGLSTDVGGLRQEVSGIGSRLDALVIPTTDQVSSAVALRLADRLVDELAPRVADGPQTERKPVFRGGLTNHDNSSGGYCFCMQHIHDGGYGQWVPSTSSASPGWPPGVPNGRLASARQSTLRENNLALVARTVCASPTPLSRAGVAARTSMTRSTVSRLVDDLVAGGVLTELEPPTATGPGRPRWQCGRWPDHCR